MAVIHFLNVKQGDCSVIQHNSGRVTVIDVCNAKSALSELCEKAAKETVERLLDRRGPSGNFNQKEHPVNPVTYLKGHGIASVFRFILTHPDMDHMDGIKVFFEEFSPGNFWDTDNNEEKEFEEGGPFNAADWEFYKGLRHGKPTSTPKRLTLHSGSKGSFWNRGEDGASGGDGLTVLAPTPSLVSNANEQGDHNDCSYVILYKTAERKIVFGGDSHDGTWEHILGAHRELVADVDLLIAPHHGRMSGRSYEFLDVLRPKLTFFGNAPCEHLAYDAWNSRELPFVTNNQAGSMIVDVVEKKLRLHVTNDEYAKTLNDSTYYSETVRGYFVLEY